jgi:hypothetical protein
MVSFTFSNACHARKNKVLHPHLVDLRLVMTILHSQCWINLQRFWMQDNGQKKFVHWYNNEHLHSTLKFVTPQQRHSGYDKRIRAKRHMVYQMAKAQNSEHWAGETRDWSLPDLVMLNPNRKKEGASKLPPTTTM